MSAARAPFGTDPMARIDGFVARYFTWPGSLRLNRMALGWDIARAPANLLLSPVLVLPRLLAWVLMRLGLGRAAGWLRGRRIVIRTAVAAQVEAAVLHDLLDVSLPQGIPRDRAATARAILAAPSFRAAVQRCGSIEGAQAMADRVAGALGDYSGTRSAMAEIVTAFLTLVLGAMVFHALTPGMISMAPGVAGALAHSVAIADFPLGDRLGGVWYGVFPVGPSPGLVAASFAGLLLMGSTVTAFAGIVADPLQVRTGLHRRRLVRLMHVIEAERSACPGAGFAAREHLVMRVFDLWDTALAALRVFRG
ncbi:DUF6635 family protein [Roseicyclus mahoneyensis]|uniref:Uncharacterized protein n=1 Tax=Roseicyclus mahoneyensis TaxID=164332 RepID=A0A316GP42_9RHOB|nr:DUF6635 family protein [Roseicyclus mahoneyensis]PWK62121.1 hypothetical protein C7455_101147 [Roseicyclus mahoneyensis]